MIKHILLATFAMSALISCVEDDAGNISATLSGDASIIQGDSAELVLEINGNNPPYAFRYNDGNNYYVKTGIETNTYSIKVSPSDTTTYTAEAIATYNGPSKASGTATINVRSATFSLVQSLSPTKGGFLHRSNGLNLAVSEIDIRNQGSQWDRTGFIEFDAEEITTLHEKNQYKFTFWLTRSHAQGVGINPGKMEIKGSVGVLDEDISWDTQPAESDLILQFSEVFDAPASTDEQIEFSGDITAIVNAALENPSTNKFIIRIMEVANGGLYYLGGPTFPEESQRPVVDVYVRD